MAIPRSARSTKPARVQTASYCLYCYAPLETTGAVSQQCPRCGRRHSRGEHAQYWSREPRLREYEVTIKALIVLAVLALVPLIIKELGSDSSPLILFFIGPLVWFGGVLYWTVGLLTRRPRYFSARLLWLGTITLYVVGTPLLMFTLDLIARREDFGAEYWRKYLVLLTPAVPLLILASALGAFGRRFEEFKRRRIEQGLGRVEAFR